MEAISIFVLVFFAVDAVLRIPARKKAINCKGCGYRVNGRFKKFKITPSVIPISQFDLLNEIMVTVCGLTNLNPSVVNV